MKVLFVQVELMNSRGETVVYWIPAAPNVRLGLKLRLEETYDEEWTVTQTFMTSLGIPPVPHRVGTPHTVRAGDSAA